MAYTYYPFWWWEGTNTGPLVAYQAVEEITARLASVLAFLRLLGLFLARKLRCPHWPRIRSRWAVLLDVTAGPAAPRAPPVFN